MKGEPTVESDDRQERSEPTEEFEYVVVGSGAGGGPLAANLAQSGHTVLLLEAGGDDTTLNYSIPAFHGLATEDAQLRWDYFVKHYSVNGERDEKFCTDRDGVLYPRAGTLGGCTAHYALIIVYPHDSDWQHIAAVTGDKSWWPENMRKYFERLERYHHIDPDVHASGDKPTGDDSDFLGQIFAYGLLRRFGDRLRGAAERRTVTLQCHNPRKVPEINFRYFAEGNDTSEKDLESVVEGVKFARRMNERIRHLIEKEELPGEQVKTDEQIREFIQNNAWGHHACGTCKIGSSSDPCAVVDSQFRVHGVKNLRVVDASVFPKIPGFFIVTPIYMISEKASDVIHEAALRTA